MTTAELLWLVPLTIAIVQNSFFIAVARSRSKTQEQRIQALEKKLSGTKC